MSKRNKVRYKSQGNVFPRLVINGNVWLRHVDEEAMLAPQKGDLQIFLSTDSIAFNTHVGDYEAMGFDGYLKADVYDGKGWRPISLEEFFANREYYFGKRERPIDTYNLCLPTFKNMQGAVLMRTYREHYVLEPKGAAPTKAEEE